MSCFNSKSRYLNSNLQSKLGPIGPSICNFYFSSLNKVVILFWVLDYDQRVHYIRLIYCLESGSLILSKTQIYVNQQSFVICDQKTKVVEIFIKSLQSRTL